MAPRSVGLVILALGFGLAADSFAQAENPSEPTTDESEVKPALDEATKRGRAAYVRGVALAKNEQWGAALEAFQQAAKARDAPLVQFNIAYCQRALGHYVAARTALDAALQSPDELPPPQRADARAFRHEFEQLIVQLDVVLEPPTAKLSVDGRPLVVGRGALLAGVAPPGDGNSPPTRRFTVHLDPGAHVFRAIRKGHDPAVVNRSYKEGQRAKLDLALDLLPATVRIESMPPGAIVRVDGRESGVAPLEIQRMAGRYDVEVSRSDYETYTATLELTAGQHAHLEAQLMPYETPIYETWWFWTTAGAVVAGGALLTWALTRPEPEPPPYDTGNTGWLVEPALIRF